MPTGIVIEYLDKDTKEVISERYLGCWQRITNYDTNPVQIVEKRWEPVPSVVHINRVWVHVAVSGGDGGNPVAIANNGTHSCTLDFVLRETEDPASAVLDTINHDWDVKLRDDEGNLYDYIRVRFVNGQASITYTATKPAMVSINPADVKEVIGTSYITLATGPKFKVLRNFT